MRFRADVRRPLRYLHEIRATVEPQGLRVLGPQIADLADSATQRAFDSGRDPETLAPWPPRKPRKGQTHKLMVKTGLLRSSVHAVIEVPGSGRLRVRGTITGKAAGYGPFHHTGTRRMPRRRFIGVSDAQRRQIAEMITDHIKRAV